MGPGFGAPTPTKVAYKSKFGLGDAVDHLSTWTWRKTPALIEFYEQGIPKIVSQLPQISGVEEDYFVECLQVVQELVWADQSQVLKDRAIRLTDVLTTCKYEQKNMSHSSFMAWAAIRQDKSLLKEMTKIGEKGFEARRPSASFYSQLWRRNAKAGKVTK